MNRLQLSCSETSLLVVREGNIPRQHITLNTVSSAKTLGVIYLITLYVDDDQNIAVIIRSFLTPICGDCESAGVSWTQAVYLQCGTRSWMGSGTDGPVAGVSRFDISQPTAI